MEAHIKTQRYYRTEKEFKNILLKLKFDACPHCLQEECLILHGYLYGYGEDPKSQKEKRGHRIFCSNRRKRKGKGCGRTFSVLLSDFIKKHIISAKSVWKFLNNINEDKSLVSALRSSDSDIGEAGIYHIFKKFEGNQINIRTLLMSKKDPPILDHTKNSVIQTIAHLRSAFKDSPCPVSQFQYHFQTSFL